jgi:hypothetical protein
MIPLTGTVPDKMFRVPYTCIVMELLEGGELFDKIEWIVYINADLCIGMTATFLLMFICLEYFVCLYVKL